MSVTMINGGSAFNVIPDSVSLSGTARAMNSASRQQIHDEIETIT